MAMEHIRQFDWCSSRPDINFVNEQDMDHCVIERILRNKFHNPAISSDSDDNVPNDINWDEIFSKKQNFQYQQKSQHVFVPCLSQCPPPYPKVSVIDGKQQYRCMKVLSKENPHILPGVFIHPPNKGDRKLFEELKTQYENEQKEFTEWAKTMWTNVHCVRALHPKPHVETVYEARFQMRATEMSSYPKTYQMAAQIPLEKSNGNACEMVLDKEIKKVNIKSLPRVECRDIIKKISIIQPCNLPEPCTKHPCKFILPNENSVSILPLTEVQRELAQFALDNNAHYIVSENSLKCLVDYDRPWDISIAVTGVIGPDGETTNVVVLGSEFAVHKEPVLTRTYQAFKHLLQHSLVPPSEKFKLNYKDPNDKTAIDDCVDDKCDNYNMAEESDDDDDRLCIDEVLRVRFGSDDETETNDKAQSNNEKEEKSKDDTITRGSRSKSHKETQPTEDNSSSFYSCTCKDTIFERPPPRSFSRWRVRDKTTGENCNVIVHCAHKVRDEEEEVILEPIPEYQLDLGGSAQPPGRLRSLGLSLHLRKNAFLVNVRVDGETGEVATFERADCEQFEHKHGDVMSGVADTLHATFSQLQGLLPGNYLLRHTPSHGMNALLYAAKSSSNASFTLDFDCSRLEEADESKSLKTAPTLTPVLLPFHKYRKLLPCAFTPHQYLVPREPRRPPQRQKAPPQALQWPKRKKKKIAKSCLI